jgi:hypothetical protein
LQLIGSPDCAALTGLLGVPQPGGHQIHSLEHEVQGSNPDKKTDNNKKNHYSKNSRNDEYVCPYREAIRSTVWSMRFRVQARAKTSMTFSSLNIG